MQDANGVKSVAKIKKRGADCVVEALQAHNVHCIFSLSGNQIMPLYDALFDSSIRVLHTRHEGGAVYMAEAYAQMSGDVGVVLITAAPGFANGLSAMYTARESETPIVVLSGDSPTHKDGRGAFQEFDQCAAAQSIAKTSFRATDATGLHDDIAKAISLAKSGRPGPVHVALPDDILRNKAIAASSSKALASRSELPKHVEEAVEAVHASLLVSKTPLLLAGPAFCRTHTKPKLRQLASDLGVPIVVFESPRGLKAPRLGAFVDVAGEADLIVTLGKPLDFMIGFGDASVLSHSCKIIQIDADAAMLERDRKAHSERDLLQYQLEPNAVISHLLSSDSLSKNAAHHHWRQDVEAAISYRPDIWKRPPPDEPVNSLAFANAIGEFAALNADASLIIDGGEIGQWAQALADSDNAIINGPSGAIGASIPYAIGAHIARPNHPVLSVMGDGTAGFYLAEFETAVRENIPFVAVIGNDAKWNAEHQIQLRDYGEARTFGCELTPARYDQVVADLGGYGEIVTQASQILPAINRAFASGKPACINVMIDGQAAPVISR